MCESFCPVVGQSLKTQGHRYPSVSIPCHPICLTDTNMTASCSLRLQPVAEKCLTPLPSHPPGGHISELQFTLVFSLCIICYLYSYLMFPLIKAFRCLLLSIPSSPFSWSNLSYMDISLKKYLRLLGFSNFIDLQ